MSRSIRRSLWAAGGAAALSILCLPAKAALSAKELARLAQNPAGNLISLPFQNNTNFNTGPLSGTPNILNIRPVVPIEVDKVSDDALGPVRCRQPGVVLPVPPMFTMQPSVHSSIAEP